MRWLLLSFIFILSISLTPPTARAQWQSDGVALSTGAGDQLSPTIISDGAGGAIVTWQDRRSGTWDIYAQRVNASGAPQWTADGVALCAAVNNQSSPTIVSDGAGGAIVTWYDLRGGATYDIYAQRVSASGAPQWTADGVALCAAGNSQQYPTIISDGAGGAIVTWQDFRNNTNDDIYARRVNASGVPQWTANGVALCVAAGAQTAPTIVSDGSGGAIVTWEDSRSGAIDVYAQRVNASGAPQWAADGVALSTAANNQVSPMVVPDGAGGAIATWEDSRSGATPDIYAQRVNASGAPQWVFNGVALSTAGNEQQGPTIVSDGVGGAIVAWQDRRSGTNTDIYAQRVNTSGAPQWAFNGVALCTDANSQFSPTIASDGAGGAIVTWGDFRNGTYDIYAQRVNASGASQWSANGLAFCTAANDQVRPTIISDGAGGAVVTWYDLRSGTYDIYAQRVESRYGYWGHPEPVVTSVADVPGDQGGKVKVNWTASGQDVPNLRTIEHYSIWRATDTKAASLAIARGATVGGPSDISSDFDGSAIWVDRRENTDYYWEWIANQEAHYVAAYSFSASTRSDSTSEGTSAHQFFVSAHTNDPYVFFDSNAMSGHSVDNLAPAAPLFLTAQRVGADVQLRWNRVRVPDLRDYSVYRATSSGVTPVPINFLANSDDTVATDAGAPTSALYYIVTAYDVHENQSAPSNEANVGATTDVGNAPPITAVTVLDNVPNPFTASTVLRIGLPKASDVEIEVFDVAGRRVTSEHTATLAAGWREVAFEARDAGGNLLPSGVYFYRVRAAGETITRKMVIAR